MHSEQLIQQLKCSKCFGSEHLSNRCPFIIECIYCTNSNHRSDKCNRTVCFRCKHFGHIAKECKENIKEICRICKHIGHLSEKCIIRTSPIDDNINLNEIKT